MATPRQAVSKGMIDAGTRPAAMWLKRLSGSQRGSRVGITTPALSCNWSPRAPLLRTCWCGAHASALPPRRRTPDPVVPMGGLEGVTFPSRSGGVIGAQASTVLPFGGLLLLHLSFWPANEVRLGWPGYVATRLRIQLSEGCGHTPSRQRGRERVHSQRRNALPRLWLLSTCT